MQTSNVVTLIIDGKNKAVTAIKDAMGNLTELDNAAKKSNSNLGNMFDSVKSIAAIAGIGLTAGALFSFGKDAIIASARLSVLRDNFKGTTQDIELFQKATAGTVTEANLIKLSNQATDLGLTMKEQAILFSLAEDAADKYGGGVEENFQRVLKASEGGTKGLKDLGIQKAVYDEIVKSYLNDYGVKNLDQLDAEAQKWIQVEAMIKATGVTLDDVAKKLPDAADKIEAVGVKWEEFKTRSGDVLLPILGTIVGTIISLDDWAIKAGNDLDHLIGLKGILGNGDQSKPPDNTQNQVDLMNALSHNTYVDKNGKLVSEEIVKGFNKIKNDDDPSGLKKMKDQAEEYLKALNFENSLFGLNKFEKKEEEIVHQAELAREKFSQFPAIIDAINFNLGKKLSELNNSLPGVDNLIPKEFKDTDLLKGVYEGPLSDANVRMQSMLGETTISLETMADIAAGTFGSMAESMMMGFQQAGGASEAWFNTFKAIKIAETIISTISSAEKSYDWASAWGGPVAGTIAAAIAYASGIARVGQITSVGRGSVGGGGSVASSSAALPSASSIQNSSITNNNNARHVTINIHSIGGFGSNADKIVRDELAPAIRRAIKDGVIDFGGD